MPHPDTDWPRKHHTRPFSTALKSLIHLFLNFETAPEKPYRREEATKRALDATNDALKALKGA